MSLNRSSAIQVTVFVMCFSLIVRAEIYVSESGRHQGREYSECIGSAQLTHPEMIGCVQLEIERHKSHISSAIERNGGDDSLSELIVSIEKSSGAFDVYVNELCDAYHALEGQRAEVLRVSCLLKEVIHREIFVRQIINEAQI